MRIIKLSIFVIMISLLVFFGKNLKEIITENKNLADTLEQDIPVVLTSKVFKKYKLNS